jgi:hypothetical protein
MLQEGWIGPEAPAWTGFLETSPHDFDYIPRYVALTARPFIAHAGDVASFVPLHFRLSPPSS